MPRGNPWVHGSRTFCGNVVEVREVKHMRKGLPAAGTGRWEARMLLGKVLKVVEVRTTESYPSQEQAEEVLLDQLRKLREFEVEPQQ